MSGIYGNGRHDVRNQIRKGHDVEVYQRKGHYSTPTEGSMIYILNGKGMMLEAYQWKGMIDTPMERYDAEVYTNGKGMVFEVYQWKKYTNGKGYDIDIPIGKGMMLEINQWKGMILSNNRRYDDPSIPMERLTNGKGMILKSMGYDIRSMQWKKEYEVVKYTNGKVLYQYQKEDMVLDIPMEGIIVLKLPMEDKNIEVLSMEEI
ncbi:unnamed protein product [Mytilus edulis]|uniref:Uncharacterized protein n=1 Tax=Mytilus edulis TaxID=6550 RepID=A0A8S3SUQ8_MYTED|nr:unnamed protein product [Mytilus edulis]